MPTVFNILPCFLFHCRNWEPALLDMWYRCEVASSLTSRTWIMFYGIGVRSATGERRDSSNIAFRKLRDLAIQIPTFFTLGCPKNCVCGSRPVAGDISWCSVLYPYLFPRGAELFATGHMDQMMFSWSYALKVFRPCDVFHVMTSP